MSINERTVTEPLDPESALQLLSLAHFGRLGMSKRALPAVVPVRHVVTDGTVLVRSHRACGHHRSCDGAVVAFQADRLEAGEREGWFVHIVGMARAVEPTKQERTLFGRAPAFIDGEPYDPVYLRIAPEIVTGRRMRTLPLIPHSRRPPEM